MKAMQDSCNCMTVLIFLNCERKVQKLNPALVSLQKSKLVYAKSPSQRSSDITKAINLIIKRYQLPSGLNVIT